MKNYRAQTPQNLALTKILQKFSKRALPGTYSNLFTWQNGQLSFDWKAFLCSIVLCFSKTGKTMNWKQSNRKILVSRWMFVLETKKGKRLNCELPSHELRWLEITALFTKPPSTVLPAVGMTSETVPLITASGFFRNCTSQSWEWFCRRLCEYHCKCQCCIEFRVLFRAELHFWRNFFMLHMEFWTLQFIYANTTFSGTSRIFPRGCTNSQKCYYFAFFLLKTAWKWKNLDPNGEDIHDAPPWIR